ncbi:iron ABC transporter permease [Treponema sp. OMZ 792]|uniref:FecCD family ABC transporter permease n=1 Tax=unclassified Treponema TaxID=2638727 RepID=UPI0020A3FCB7|nr:MULTISPECIES: iron ABC transporter permease [unclassified Treponema]UTC75316.1 iron ABC transporter permease [Treponema sp. OMZ 792]UTC79319.1 iron ABC transporter permease [Treponema sp. OMZ 798]
MQNNKTKVLKIIFISSALLFLLAGLLLSIILSVGFGAVNIVPADILKIAQYKIFGIGSLEGVKKSTVDIVWIVRMPRIILACLTGMGLALTGVVMQAIVKNSLADPYILGISSGASLGATLAIALGIGASLGPNYVGLSACFSAFGASVIVMTTANINGRANSVKLLMAGIAISTIFSAFSSFIVFTTKNREAIRSISFWLMGGFGGAKWENLGLLSVIVFLSIFAFMTQYRTLNLMLLGDSVSITLGKDLHIYRQIYLLMCSAVIGFLVYNAGIIGFIGLIVPHIARIFWGTNHKNIIPASVLIGAIILVWADVLARSISSLGEIPVGVVISLVGAPVFLYLLINKEYGFGGKS